MFIQIQLYYIDFGWFENDDSDFQKFDYVGEKIIFLKKFLLDIHLTHFEGS